LQSGKRAHQVVGAEVCACECGWVWVGGWVGGWELQSGKRVHQMVGAEKGVRV